MPKTKPFDNYSKECDNWFVDNYYTFQSELRAIKKVTSDNGNGIEIGVESGIFAEPLGIKEGIEPSKAMREKAEKRNINVIDVVAEDLPYPDKSKDFVLMITTICFVDDNEKPFMEANRVLKKSGSIILRFVDKDSPVGKIYMEHQSESVFIKTNFLWNRENLWNFKKTWFKIENTHQTVFG